MKIEVEASNARPSGCMPPDSLAVDVDVAVTIGDRVVESEVTLLPREQHGTPGGEGYGAWGQPDHWVDRDLLRALDDLPRDEFHDALSEIEAAASREAGRVDWENLPERSDLPEGSGNGQD